MNMKVVLALLVLCATSFFFKTEAAQFTTCPPLRDDVEAGICSEECGRDDDCTDGLKCCSNGCGHTCTRPTTIPYHSPPLNCPALDDDVAGQCSEECSDDYHCGEGELCCSNGCGHSCMEGVAPDSLCSVVSEQVSNQSLFGSYEPQCEEDGSFSLVQYHASIGYRWCVDPESGEPLSDMVFATEQLRCNCTYGNDNYIIGDSFPSEDGCNECFCFVNGDVACTERACLEQPLFYSCPAIRENEAGICVEECESHSECSESEKCCYNGCGYMCMDQVPIPHIPLPLPIDNGCPDISYVPCADQRGSCRDPGFVCDEGNVCCDNECSSAVCMSRIDSSPCLTANMLADAQNVTTFGHFRPQCDQDGLFRGIQCHEHYCWCVEPTTGRPLTDQVPFEKLGALQCSACVYEGLKKANKESFPASDGCNTCTCIGGSVACTEVYCDDDDDDDDDELWEWWHTVLLSCVVTVALLIVVMVALFIIVVVLMRQNTFRHKKLKESASASFETDSDTVQFKNGNNSTDLQDFSQEPAKA